MYGARYDSNVYASEYSLINMEYRIIARRRKPSIIIVVLPSLMVSSVPILFEPGVSGQLRVAMIFIQIVHVENDQMIPVRQSSVLDSKSPEVFLHSLGEDFAVLSQASTVIQEMCLCALLSLLAVSSRCRLLEVCSGKQIWCFHLQYCKRHGGSIVWLERPSLVGPHDRASLID